MNYTQATDLIRSHTDYGGSVDVHALAVAISSASDVDAGARDDDEAIACDSCGLTMGESRKLAAPPAASAECEALTKADMAELYYIAREKPKREWMYIVRAALAKRRNDSATASDSQGGAA